MSALYPLAFLLGLAAGSFSNVCIWRMPRGQSVLWPASRCPHCGVPIKARDNVPLLSYLLLRGRCRHCGHRISARYPLVEALSGALYVLILWRFGPQVKTLFYLAFASALVVITFIDLEHQIIPDEITLPGLALGLLAGWLFLADPFQRASALGLKASLLGALVGFSLYYLIAVLSRGGMGGGDIKLMALVGAVEGYKGVLLSTLVGSFLGSLVGLYLMLFRGRGRKTKIPFGPFLALGALVGLLWGQELLQLYMTYTWR